MKLFALSLSYYFHFFSSSFPFFSWIWIEGNIRYVSYVLREEEFSTSFKHILFHYFLSNSNYSRVVIASLVSRVRIIFLRSPRRPTF